MCVGGGCVWGLIFAPCTYKQTKLVFLLRNREVKEEGRGGGREEVEQERGGGGERWRRREVEEEKVAGKSLTHPSYPR